MICHFRSDGTILFANEAYARSRGVEASALIGKNFWDFIPEQDRADVAALLSRLTPAQPEISIENRFDTTTGSRWTLWKNYAVAFDQDGRWTQAQSIGIDISDRRQTEDELRVSNEKLRAAEAELHRAQSLGQIGSWHYDARRDAFKWSHEMYRIFGVPVGTSISFTQFLDLVHADDRPLVDGSLESSRVTNNQYNVDHRIIIAGETKWVRQRAELEIDSKDRLAAVWGTCQDISAQMSIEASLRESRERFAALVKATSEIVIEIDPAGALIGDLTAWAAFSGQTQTDWALSQWADSLHPEDKDHVIGGWQRAAQENQPYECECRLRRADGRWRWMRWTCVPVHSQDAGGAKWVGMFVDISDMKDAQQALEGRVVERTRELEAARNEAIRANTLKSKFLAAASHDLRQPLQAASLYLAALERRLDINPQREIFDRAVQSLSATGDILQALLDISRFESGAVVPQLYAFPIAEILDRILDQNGEQASAKGLRIVRGASDGVVYSDQGLLERVLENFVTNAIRYTEVGEIKVWCENEGEHVRVCVSDTGIGIAADAVDAIFEEYVQVGNEARGRGNGLGLGLAIAKHIAVLLDCQIDVRSTLGRGSIFSLVVPCGDLAKSHGGAAFVEASDHMISRTTRPAILFVDDDPIVTDAMMIVLQDAGFNAQSASEGEGALQLIEGGFRPNVIVSDFRLPGYGGIDVVRRVRAAMKADVPAVLITGDTELRDSDVAAVKDCQVLHKPFDPHRLMALIGALGR